jgi:hypothetical protein
MWERSDLRGKLASPQLDLNSSRVRRPLLSPGTAGAKAVERGLPRTR